MHRSHVASRTTTNSSKLAKSRLLNQSQSATSSQQHLQTSTSSQLVGEPPTISTNTTGALENHILPPQPPQPPSHLEQFVSTLDTLITKFKDKTTLPQYHSQPQANLKLPKQPQQPQRVPITHNNPTIASSRGPNAIKSRLRSLLSHPRRTSTKRNLRGVPIKQSKSLNSHKPPGLTIKGDHSSIQSPKSTSLDSSTTSSSPTLSSPNTQKLTNRPTKQLLRKIIKTGKRSCMYLFGLILLNEVWSVFQHDLHHIFQDNNNTQSLSPHSYPSQQQQSQQQHSPQPLLPTTTPQTLLQRNINPHYYEEHLDTTLDVILYLIARVDQFTLTFERNQFASDWVNWLTRRTQPFTEELRSNMFFWVDVAEDAVQHAVSRTFMVIELNKGPTFLPQLTPADQFDTEAGTKWPFFGTPNKNFKQRRKLQDRGKRRRVSAGQQMLIHSIPTERVNINNRFFRFPFLTPTIRIDEELIWAPGRHHYFWPMTFARWFKEILYKVALPVIDFVEWIAWAPQKYVAQRAADVFFFFDAKVAYHTRNFIQDAILSRHNFPLIEQISHMRRSNHSSFDIALFLLTYIGAAARESYRIIDKNMPKVTESDLDLAIQELEVELRALQNTSQSEIELFADHYRVYADNLPVYFSERLRPFLVRLSEQPYDPLYKYFMFSYDKPAAGVKPLESDELLILEKIRMPGPILRVLTRMNKRTLQLRMPFSDWTEHNKLLPAHFTQGFENAWSAGFSGLTKFLVCTAVLSKIPAFQRFFYRHLTLSYENRYKIYTYVASTFSSMSIITAFLSVFLMSSVFEVYSQMWGPRHFYSICYGSALAINAATQFINLSLAKTLLSLNIHRPALLAPQNGIFPLITLFWAYTSRAFPDGDLRFFYFPVGTKVEALVSGWLFLDALGFFIFTLIFNRRTGLPHLSNILGFAVGLWLYTYHCKRYNIKPGEDYRLITDETTMPHANENIPDSLIFFNIFSTPLTNEYKMKRTLWLEKNDLRRLRHQRNSWWNAQVQSNNFIEGWNLLYRYSSHRDFTVVEENLSKLRQLRQEWRANYGDDDVKAETELGIEDKNIPYLIHTARFAQRQLERLQQIVDHAWSAETGMITPKEWADLEYEQYRSRGPQHAVDQAETHLNYNRIFEGRRWAFSQKKFEDGDDDVLYDSYIPGRQLIRSLDQWMEWAETRGAVHWTARAWEVFQLQPQLFPRMSERQKRWFHPQDEYYELDYRALKNLKTKRYFAEWNKGRRVTSLWGYIKPPKREKEGLMNRHEQQMYKFARDPRIREGMMDAYEFPEMHHHPSRLWKEQERRRLAHKYITFPNFKKDWNIAWGTQPKLHPQNEWFPKKKEWDVMDDFDLEQPLFKHGELNPYIKNLAGVRQEALVKHPDSHRDVTNVEPRQWALFERKMWSHIPSKSTKIRRFQVTRPFNMVRGELDMQLDDPNRQIWSKQSRYRPKMAQYAAARRPNMDDHIKGKILETQQFWGVQKRSLNKFKNSYDKRTNFFEEDDEMSYKVDWDWQPFAMPRPRF